MNEIGRNTSNADVAEKIVIPYDKLFKNKDISRIILKKASEVRRDRVVLEDGTEVPFTFCIVATGKQWMSPLECVALTSARFSIRVRHGQLGADGFMHV